MAREHVAIVGAGLGGLTAAIALARRGFGVTLVERSRSLEEAGAGIQLSPQVMRVLSALGLGPALARHLVEPDGIIIRDAGSGREIVRLPLEGAAERWGAPYGLIHRADLQRVLLEGARELGDAVTLIFDARFNSFHDKARTLVLDVEVAGSATMIEADMLVGADGLWSAVGSAIGRSVPPQFSGHWAWRAVLATDAVPEFCRGKSTTLWLGPHAHLVLYPVRSGAALNIVAVVEDGRHVGSWSEPGSGSELAAKFRHWPPQITRLLRGHEEWRGWPLFDRSVAGPFSKGRVALIGDAAHPILPFLAQGGALAIEDAAVLAASLDTAGAIEQRLAAYGAARRDRVRRVQAESRANLARYHWPRPLSSLRNAGMRLLGPRALLARYDWLYGWQPPA